MVGQYILQTAWVLLQQDITIATGVEVMLALLLTFLLFLTLSLQVIHACDERTPTRATGMGPHYVEHVGAETKLWKEDEIGEPIFLRSRIVDTCGKALPGARVQLWHANQDGEHSDHRWRADLLTDEQGTFKITTVMPGYAGGLPKHIHFIITHAGHEELITRLFFRNDPYIDNAEVNDLAIRLDEVERDGRRGWVAGYEFVLASE